MMATSTSSNADARIRPVILSGGSGTRLWPLSTKTTPKQFLPLVGERSLLLETFLRVANRERFKAPTVICGVSHVDQVRGAAALGNITDVRIVAEPSARNTAAAIALAALTAERPDELLLILPSDHHIEQPDQFRATIEAARAAAEDGMIVTFGMKPTRVETGFGYIESGEPVNGAVLTALRFVEKPDAERARAMVESGRFAWNGGMFFAAAGALIEAFEQHSPELLAAVREAVGPVGGDVFPDADRFATVPSIAFDHAVMEKHDRVGMIPSDFGWSDVGSWTAAYERASLDGHGNAIDGRSTVIDGTGNLVRSSGPRVVALGVEGLMVLATDDVVLVAPLSDAQRVREAHAWFAEQTGQ